MNELVAAHCLVAAVIKDISPLTRLVGNLTYVALAAVALWGAFSVAMVWRRVARQRFRSEEAQDEFLNQLEQRLAQADFQQAAELCQSDPRAIPQLGLIVIQHRHLGYAKVRHLASDRFHRDVLSDLEQRLSWVNTVIKAAPMLGLFGTVIGMMGAFSTLQHAEAAVSSVALARDISLALITTACGLAIAIPLVLMTASINIRIRKMEDLVASGLGRILDALRDGLAVSAAREEEVTV